MEFKNRKILCVAAIFVVVGALSMVYASAPVKKPVPVAARYCGLMFKSDGTRNLVTRECVLDAINHGVSSIVIVPCPDGSQVPITFAVQFDGSVSFPSPIVACVGHMGQLDGGVK